MGFTEHCENITPNATTIRSCACPSLNIAGRPSLLCVVGLLNVPRETCLQFAVQCNAVQCRSQKNLGRCIIFSVCCRRQVAFTTFMSGMRNRPPPKLIDTSSSNQCTDTGSSPPTTTTKIPLLVPSPVPLWRW